MIAGWPLETSNGMLSQKEFLEMTGDEKRRQGKSARPMQQGLDLLDETHILCNEEWQMCDPDVMVYKRIFLVKRENTWYIERLLWSQAGDGEVPG